MTYTVKEVSKASGVSVRTLHYYDEIGLLKPAFYAENGYRYYGEKQLLKLQQILFFRELEIPLADIQEILESTSFNQIEALMSHKQLLEKKATRIKALLNTIDKTIKHLRGEIEMKKDDIYTGFDKEQQDKYVEELKQRYGKCAEDLIKESLENTKDWKKKDYDQVKELGDELNKALAAAIAKGLDVQSSEVQQLVKKHFEMIKLFYIPTKEVYIGLGDLYVEHPDFRKYYESFHPELTEYLRDAMKYFAENQL